MVLPEERPRDGFESGGIGDYENTLHVGCLRYDLSHVAPISHISSHYSPGIHTTTVSNPPAMMYKYRSVFVKPPMDQMIHIKN